MKTSPRLLIAFAFVALNSSLSAFAADINQIDTNTQEQLRQQERQKLLRQQQEIKPDVRENVDKLKSCTVRVSATTLRLISSYFLIK